MNQTHRTMKTTLHHLPQGKQDELQIISKTIRENCDDVEKIILFGSYARGDYKEKKDLKENRKSGHVSDYDILVVTSQRSVAEDITLWNKISDKLQKLGLSADPRIIRHDIKELNLKLMESQYFYSDVAKEGIVIFDSGKFELAERKKLSDEERNKIAKKYFDVWFKSAEGFFKYYNVAINDGDLLKAVFFLHQATESAYKTLLLVFTNYNPSEHFLKNLHTECSQYFPELHELFPKENQADKTRFELFDYAYIGARYDINYKISKEDLEILAEDVEKLLELTKERCEEKIGF